MKNDATQSDSGRLISGTATRSKRGSVRKEKRTKKTVSITATASVKTREAAIREKAYLIAERRGFIPGHELEDWLQAEAEINELSKGAYV